MMTNEMEKFRRLIAERTGLHLRVQDDAKLQHALERRLNILRLSSMSQYYQMLLADQNSNDLEWKKLISLLTTAETFFFRDRGQFGILRDHIVPEIMQRHQADQKIRFWSAGCSTGEEPYSLAILINELIPNRSGWNITIIGTDINDEAIQKARAGTYSNWSFRMVDPEIRQRYFNSSRGEWVLSPEIREMVTFRTGNLRLDPIPNRESGLYDIDLILCRNVFIYFNNESIRAVLRKFNDALVPNGYLMTGHSELYGQYLFDMSTKSFPASIVFQRNHSLETKKNDRPAMGWAQVDLPSIPQPVKTIPPSTARQARSFSPIITDIDPAHKIEVPSPPESTQDDTKVTIKRWLEEAEADLKNGNFTNVINRGDLILQKKPDHPKALFLMARAHANSGSHGEAIQCCEKIVRNDPTHLPAYYLLAHIKEDEGEIDDAKRYFKKVMYLEPNYIAAYIELASIYERENDFKRAKKMWTTAQSMLQKLTPDALIEPYEQVTAKKLMTHVQSLIDDI